MKKIDIELEGTGEGLLMHSAQNMGEPKTTKNPAKQYDPKIDAEKVAYRNDKGNLVIPARCLKACILNGASWHKFGRKSAKPIIAGCSRIEPSNIELLDPKTGKSLSDYKIDKRPVVVQRARIIRARPLIEKWVIKFTIVYNEVIIGKPDLLREILEEAGQRVGLLDNRPQRYGENGTFKVNKFMPKD